MPPFQQYFDLNPTNLENMSLLLQASPFPTGAGFDPSLTSEVKHALI